MQEGRRDFERNHGEAKGRDRAAPRGLAPPCAAWIVTNPPPPPGPHEPSAPIHQLAVGAGNRW